MENFMCTAATYLTKDFYFGRTLDYEFSYGEEIAGEKITAVIPIREYTEGHFLFMATKKGIVKKTPITDYANVRKTGLAAISLREDDELIEEVSENDEEDGSHEMDEATRAKFKLKLKELLARAKKKKNVLTISLSI
jgi:DNA gyrase/topoisomerase IV subunit A